MVLDLAVSQWEVFMSNSTNDNVIEQNSYKKIYDLMISCGKEKDQIQFLKTLLNELKKFVYFDTAWIILLDGAGNDIDWIFENEEQHWRWLYREFYKKDMNFSLKYYKLLKESSITNFLTFIDWSEEVGDFVNDYIIKRDIRYSVAFPLFDNNGMISCVFRLDLKNNKKFISSELEELELAIKPINYLYKRFCSKVTVKENQLNVYQKLTPREKEICSLLCSGVPVNRISTYCNLSTATVRKHVEHLYKKTGVNSLQEFLILMLK